MRKLSNTVASKEYVPGNYSTFEKFFTWEKLYLDFLLFNKHFKRQVQVYTSFYYCNGFFNGKRLFKNNYQNESSRIVTIL